MKHWLNKNFKTLIIAAFLIPIITVAIVSISHVTKWYGISNPISWSVYLSVGIEIAALSALAAISANMGNKVYFPFAVVTLIQFIGNIFFAYTYIDINGQSFKDWVDLVSPLTELMGVDPTDMIGNKRFLAFFAGGMLPIISLSFLHMLVKFTEEDRLKENETPPIKELETNPEDLKHFVDETTRVRLSDRDLEILEKHLLNPEGPNEKLKEAAQKYSDKVREKHVAITEEDLPPTGVYDNSEHREKLEQRNALVEMMKLDQELGLYDESFDDSMIKESERLTKIDEELKLQEEEYDNDEVSDWDETLMDGLEDEEPFFTEEEIEKILQEQPTEEEIEENFSTIEPITENLFQDEDYLTEAILEFNQQSLEEEFDESPPEEVQTFGLDVKQLNETLEEVNREIDTKIEDTPPTESVEKKKY